MRLYKKVRCTHCGHYKDLKLENDKLKKDVCVSCGEAYNITQRNADYYIDFGREGGRIRENVGKNKSTAEIILAKIKSEKAENRHLDIKKEHKIKFDVFADEYIELYAKNNNIAWKRSIVPNMNALKRFFTGKLLTEIDPHLIEKFKVERIKEVSPAATNRALTLLKSMFNRAIEWDKFNGLNPVTRVKFLREDNHKLRYLDKDEIKRLIDNCEDMLRPLIIVAVNTGLRKAELFNLKWQDIDINNGTIHLLRTKNGEKREIPMNEAVKTVIVEAKEHSDSEYVFCTKTGNPYTDIRKPFARSLKRAGIKDCLWHTLRHTFASQLAMAGVDLNTIRELLGHSSTRMTIRYAHLSSNHKNQALDLLNKCLDTTNSHCDTYVTHDSIEKKRNISEVNPTCLISIS